jgi:hypothetical protein
MIIEKNFSIGSKYEEINGGIKALLLNPKNTAY